MSAIPASDLPSTLDGGPASRLRSLDLLRGVAILGILPMNIVAFGLPMAAYQNPLALGSISEAEWWSWRIAQLLFDQRFMSIFAVMFGAGILLLGERAPRPGQTVAGRFYRRMGWLLLFGLLHAHLFWYGDILFTYALCGMLVFPLRRLGSAWLIAIGSAVLAVPIVAFVGLHLATTIAGAEALAQMRESWAPSARSIQEATAAYRGGWIEQMPQRMSASLLMQSGVFLTWSLWRASGLMLLGMVLLRWGFLSGRWSTGTYALGVIVGFGVGAAISGWGLHRNEAIDYAMIDAMTLGAIPNYVGSLFGAFGWASAVLAIWRVLGAIPLVEAFEAIGRTSFSNYLLQTGICTWIFYGHGLGWYGHVDRAHLWLVVLGVWVVQFTATDLWLRWFRIGPIEWVWRSLSEGRCLSLRNRFSSETTVA